MGCICCEDDDDGAADDAGGCIAIYAWLLMGNQVCQQLRSTKCIIFDLLLWPSDPLLSESTSVSRTHWTVCLLCTKEISTGVWMVNLVNQLDCTGCCIFPVNCSLSLSLYLYLTIVVARHSDWVCIFCFLCPMQRCGVLMEISCILVVVMVLVVMPLLPEPSGNDISISMWLHFVSGKMVSFVWARSSATCLFRSAWYIRK